MSSAPFAVSIPAARRFLRRALLLDAPAPDVGSALAHHGYVQIDPINVCGRMHDLILRNRVAGYREGDLMRHLHGEETAAHPAEQRTAFEHHLPSTGILVALGLEAWPHLQAAMRARTKRSGAWSGKLAGRERELATPILAAIAAEGPLNADRFADGRRGASVWGRSTLAKATLQKLFFHGRVLIFRRDGNRRVYDLPERVLPARVLNLPEASAAETARWQALLKLRQRRLTPLSREELRHVGDEVQAVRIPECGPLYCLKSDHPLLAACLDEADRGPAVGAAVGVVLMAPLDPLLYDRRLTRRLWGFDYTWEVYTPEARRVRGYYALPVLAGFELVGHVEPKADRATGRLGVVSRRVGGRHRTAPAVAQLAGFLGLKMR